MMRTLCLLAITAISSVAFAYPKEGDKVEFTGTTTYANNTKSSVFASIEIYEYLPERKEFLVRQESLVDGAGKAITQFVSEDDFVTKEAVVETIASCKKIGGKLGAVTVPAGTFQACALPTEDEQSKGTVWLADVPFGAVQADTRSKIDNSRTVLKMKSVTSGN